MDLPTYVQGFHDEAAVRVMPYREFGGRRISALSFGTSPLAGVYGAIDAEEATACVVSAVRAGVNMIDTAPWYGHGLSETVLGGALARIPRAAYYLHTKVARYLPSQLATFDFSYDRTLASVYESLERLQVDYIDVMQVHDPEFSPSLRVVLEQTLPALAEARRRGLIRGIGLTGYPLDMLRELLEGALASGAAPITSLVTYARYTLADTSLESCGLIDACMRAGVGLICAAPLALGLLTHAGPPPWHEGGAGIKAAAAAAAAHAAARGVRIERLAMAFALRNEALPTILFSTPRAPELVANLALATGAAPLSPLEEEVLLQLRTSFVAAAEGGSGTTAWEGSEVARYWRDMSRALREGWAGAPPAGEGDADEVGAAQARHVVEAWYDARAPGAVSAGAVTSPPVGSFEAHAFALLDAANPRRSVPTA